MREALLTILGRDSRNSPDDAREPARGPSAGSGGSTVLGPGSRFVGELSGDEDIVLNGKFHGTVRIDRRVTVGPQADVEGEIHARHVVIGGRVRGDVHAAERAELTSTGVVEGSVQAPKVVIAEGARIDGSVAMAPGGKAGDAAGGAKV